jgi:hypothetical protein
MTRLSINNHDAKLFDTGLGKGIELLNRLNGAITADDAQELIETPELIGKWCDGLPEILKSVYEKVGASMWVGPDTYVHLSDCNCATCSYNGFTAVTIVTKQGSKTIHINPSEERVHAKGSDGQNIWFRRTEFGGDIIVRVRPKATQPNPPKHEQYKLEEGFLSSIGAGIEATVSSYEHSCYHCCGDEALVVKLQINGGNASGETVWVHLYDGLWHTIKDIQIAPARGARDTILVRPRKR